jgi:hypothetical protein
MHIRRMAALIGLAYGSGLFAANAPDRHTASQFLAKIPLSFERNAGQVADKSVAWVGRGNGYRVALDATGATIAPSASARSDMVRLRFLNARPEAGSQPLEPLPGKANYLFGADPKRWIQNLETYSRIEYRNVYDGIDVAWYGNQGQIEYDFVVHPGADGSRIRMGVEGAGKLALAADGGVDIETAAGAMQLRLPGIYQDIGGVRRPVQGGYVLESANTIGLKLTGYDMTRPLVIDPTLVYGSYLGSGFTPYTVATDPSGNVYIAGSGSAGLATKDAAAGYPYQGELTTAGSCFVMKLSVTTTETTVLYATYIGGSNYSYIQGIAVDSSGNLVGTGTTGASDFPIIPANANSTPFDTVNNQSAFVLKLQSGGTPAYSTYLSSVVGFAVALDASRNAYIVGDTYATGVATPGVWQTTYGGGFNDAFAAKLNASGVLQYFTFLGGSGYDQGTAIAVDSLGDAYVAGFTNSLSFPGNPPGQVTTNAGGYDAFIAEISPTASSVTWLTFFGGTGNETTTALVRDPSSGLVYVAGYTTSADLPTTAGVFQPSPNGPEQGFIASFNPAGSPAGAKGFATYLGGDKDDFIYGMTEPSSGGLVVAGFSTSSNLASTHTHAIQPAFVGNGISLEQSTNYGGVWAADDTRLAPQVLALTGDPSSTGTILALSTDPLAVFRKTSTSASWTAEPLNSTLWYSLGTAEFVRAPANPDVVYAYIPFAGGPAGNGFVFQSTDDGVTWTTLPVPPASSTDYLDGVAVSAADTTGNTLVEVFYSGAVYQSTDGGATFTVLPSLSGGPCYIAWQGPLTTSPDGSFYLANYNGICKSTDNGSTWTFLANSSTVGYAIALAVSAGTSPNPATLYALTYNGVYVSVDGGNTWSTGTSPGGTVSMLAVAPSNSRAVYAAGSGGVFVSTNGAATWSPAGSLPFSPNAIAVNPSHAAVVYAGGTSATDGFAAKLNITGTSLLWSTFYSGSNTTQATSVAPVRPAGSGNVWIAGWAQNTDLPVTANAYSTLGSNTTTGFLAQISDTTAVCSSLSLNPGSGIFYGAGRVDFSITAPSGCTWTASPTGGITFTSPPAGSGTASGIVSASLAPNGTAGTLSGGIEVNAQTFSITQAASSCTYAINPATPATVPSSGGTVTFTVTAPTGCPWSVVLPGPFISVVSGGSGTGTGAPQTVELSLPPNPSVQWLNPVVQVGSQSVTLSEANFCAYTFAPPSPLQLGAQAAAGNIAVTANHAGCSWTPVSNDTAWLTVSGSGIGSGNISYSVQANTGASRHTTITLDPRTSITVEQGPG